MMGDLFTRSLACNLAGKGLSVMGTVKVAWDNQNSECEQGKAYSEEWAMEGAGRSTLKFILDCIPSVDEGIMYQFQASPLRGY